ncbi:MAG: SPFH/Band 7/PHB domain protein [Patescibacteria group bacterium]|nr:SPFH/Band 7/PHB domain protein [Patescibacteria group bacterium]
MMSTWLLIGAIIVVTLAFVVFMVLFLIRIFFSKKKDVGLNAEEQSFAAVAKSRNLQDAGKNLDALSVTLKETVTRVSETIEQQEKIARKQKKGAAKDKHTAADIATDSNPIGEYHEGAGNVGWWIAIYVIAGIILLISTITLLSLGGWWKIFPGLAITTVLISLAILIIKGASTVAAGYVGVVTTFRKYSGTVNSGLRFFIPGINEYEEVPVGEQTMPLNLTTEENGDVELEENVSIGITATVYYQILTEGAHMALFNINAFEANGYEKALNRMLDSMLRAHVAQLSFSKVNSLRGKSLLLNLFKISGDETQNDWSDAEMYERLSKSKNWMDIREDWGIEINDLVITDLIFSDDDVKAWEAKFKAKQQLEVSKVEVEIAEQQKLSRIKLAEAAKQELTLEGYGLGNQIDVAIKSSNASGSEVLGFLNRRQKYEAVTKGANTILIDEGSGNNAASQGVGIAAGISMFNNNKNTELKKERKNDETKKEARVPSTGK